MFFLFMASIVIFILAFALAPSLSKSSNQAQSNMNCSNASIDASQKVACTTTDISTPFVVAIILGLAIISLGAKILIG